MNQTEAWEEVIAAAASMAAKAWRVDHVRVVRGDRAKPDTRHGRGLVEQAGLRLRNFHPPDRRHADRDTATRITIMTPAQRSLYFGTLWPAACEVQGWSSKDDDRRRQVTQDATGQASASGLTESQITALFDHLKWLADPCNLDKAMPVANPEIGEDNHRRRQLIWRITKAAATAGLNDTWLAQTTREKRRVQRVGTWQELPLTELLKLSYTVSSRTTEDAQSRRRKRTAKRQQAPCSPPAELPF